MYAKGYRIRMERQRDYDNFVAYIQGVYVREALMATVGNMFKKKSAKPYEYPEKPFDLGEQRELTEADKEMQRQAFLDSLLTMQHNFELFHKNDNKGVEA